jgi:hypothetical protein
MMTRGCAYFIKGKHKHSVYNCDSGVWLRLMAAAESARSAASRCGVSLRKISITPGFRDNVYCKLLKIMLLLKLATHSQLS